MATPSREPAAYAELARLVIVGLVGTGWLTLDDNTANGIATAVGLVASWVLSYVVRQRVTPVRSGAPASLAE